MARPLPTESPIDINSCELANEFPGLSFGVKDDGIIEWVGERVASRLSINKDQLIGTTLQSFLTHLLLPESQALAQSYIQKVLSGTDNSSSFSAKVRNLDNQHPSYFEFKIVAVPGGAIVLGAFTETVSLENPKSAALRQSYQRLLSSANTIILRTDPSFSLIEVIGNVESLFGTTEDRILRGGMSLWRRLIHRDDFQRLSEHLAESVCKPTEFTEEFRVIHLSDGSLKHLLAKVVPILGDSGELIGWEGIGIDITEIRSAEDELKAQKERTEALYEVARSLQLNLDPSLVALRGLRALLRATHSDSGLVFFFDERSETLELAAAEGVGEKYITEVERLINGPSLVRYAIAHRETIRVDNIQIDERAVIRTAKIEGLKSAIVAPLITGRRALGAIVVFRKEVRAYGEADMVVVTAAANQVASATWQAELYAGERRQASYFGALYRLSHELSGHLSPKEISQRAFHILNRELACKRMWLGVMNEQGTHLIGQAGFGPGVRKSLVTLQVEIERGSDNCLAQALENKEPVVVTAGDWSRCAGLDRIMVKLHPGAFVIVPLVSLGQSIGALVIEPAVSTGFFSSTRLTFLSSMASEIAVVLLANRFQSKVAEADKMRMAGLFASGIAHNFNNMLQAILGQASLLELQVDGRQSIKEAASVIKSAAQRGAALVRQLLSFSSVENVERQKFKVRELLDQSRDLYKAILGSGIDLLIEASCSDDLILADKNQIQQVISNLLVNSKEAIGGNIGIVEISIDDVILKPGEVDPELTPGKYLRIDIKDNGVGMTDEVRARCFEPFFTTKNVDSVTGIGISGSGLGLSTAYSILRQHDGLITAQSDTIKGSVFTLYIPLLESKSLPNIQRGVVSVNSLKDPIANPVSSDKPLLKVTEANEEQV